MADFTELRPSFPFLDIDQNMEQINQFLNCESFLPFSNYNFFPISNKAPGQIPGNLAENFQGAFHHSNINQNILPVSQSIVTAEGENKKTKATDVSESSYENSFLVSERETKTKTKNISGRRKRVKGNEKEKQKPEEVAHVRARRGQATDSHSLAERVRRGKINERLRCLKDIVPGCYKTMGMAVMLDEIINYVQSLQNQVEFLSMKLTAASTFYDFNSESDAIETMQRAKAYEAKEIERLMREGYGGFDWSSSSLARPLNL